MKMTRSEFRGFVALATVLLLLLSIIAIQQYADSGIGTSRGAITEPDTVGTPSGTKEHPATHIHATDSCRLPGETKERIGKRAIKRNKSTGKKKARIKSAPQDLSSPHERPVK